MVKAKSIMTENVVTISESDTIAKAIKLLIEKRVSSLLVVKENKPVAFITEKDLVKAIASKSPDKAKVREFMNRNFAVISPGTKYFLILKKFRQENIKRFTVVENNKLIGIITETDVVDAMRDFTKFHQIMQEAILVVFGLFTAFFLFFFSPFGQYIKDALI